MLSGVFSSGGQDLGEDHRSEVPFLAHHLRGTWHWFVPFWGHINLDPLVKVVSARVLHFKVTIFPCVINKYFGEKPGGEAKTPFSLAFHMGHFQACALAHSNGLLLESALLLHGDVLSSVFRQSLWGNKHTHHGCSQGGGGRWKTLLLFM